LVEHFAEIARAEAVEAEPEALAMIARAAEGSARDGLSILDQAIALGSGSVSAELVRDMLGLADRGRIRRLLQLVLTGDATTALAELDEFYALGTDASSLLRGLMEELHSATRVKAGAGVTALQSTEQRQSAEELAGKLSWADIHRLWQMLLKGLGDVQVAPDPQEAATMALLRLIHAADLPDPAAVLARLSGETGTAAAVPSPKVSAAQVASALPRDFKGLVKLLEDNGKLQLAQQLHDQVGLVRFAPPELALKPLKPLGADWTRELDLALKGITGIRWQISISDETAEASLHEQEKMAEERVRAEVLAEPNVRAVLEAFPDASLESFEPSDSLDLKGA
jgi:DNA polymerase-3 subunit gamma/tau